jgi:integrase
VNIPSVGAGVKPFDSFNTAYGGVVVAGRRRGRGEGSIYRRKDGRWVGQYEVGGKRRNVYGKTRRDVAARLAKAVADGNEGLIFDSEHLTVAQYLDRWLDSIRGTVRESTWVRHEINVRVHLKPALVEFSWTTLECTHFPVRAATRV